MKRNKVILVDEQDHVVGEMDKMEAHEKGILHRAFSIFIFNTKGQMLIHQRANEKYHGGGLWTNACCSHPQLDEDIEESAKERLQFEMGLQCELKRVFSFIYHTPVENNLIEHEYDHVLVGYTDREPVPNVNEVINYKWIDRLDLLQQIAAEPDAFTYWFRIALPQIIKHI
ncbi:MULTISPECIES: isopentenyl-diphosphate Delta-isomerase [unclassified Sphingobacterium]|uniref:isopentenyl-diphosphate Delta-isomerase n=1 Tax=unclassified Sphingobacterium TaxID=2609468 RepID=UPI00104B3A6E|nr:MULTISPECIES: isopentenyl-diphosphate Delta-isomerase [unclassified Sphingobacterium]MCS3553447.1 isopentenyl-diphosphate delta-isomerase [Sphingobacterium sp. JUb21]TCR09343.1 isopentenyl-diphosphate delta-isomerase [Sphingobacterium sp. JUb20]